jgi:hypothetical protein
VSARGRLTSHAAVRATSAILPFDVANRHRSDSLTIQSRIHPSSPGELTVSWDRVDDHSQIDHGVAMPLPTVDAERLATGPGGEDVVAESPRDGHPRFQAAESHGEPARPAPKVVLATQLVNRDLDQRPA